MTVENTLALLERVKAAGGKNAIAVLEKHIKDNPKYAKAKVVEEPKVEPKVEAKKVGGKK